MAQRKSNEDFVSKVDLSFLKCLSLSFFSYLSSLRFFRLSDAYVYKVENEGLFCFVFEVRLFCSDIIFLY